MADESFHEGITTKYLGSWTRDEVCLKLTEYNCLVLFSDGEAAPMVVPEAFAAGLSVVISESAKANIDKTKEFISILPDGVNDKFQIKNTIVHAIQENNTFRNAIRTYATVYFDYEIIVKEYIVIVTDFIRSNIKKRNYPYIFSLKYIFSRAYIQLSFFIRKLKKVYNK